MSLLVTRGLGPAVETGADKGWAGPQDNGTLTGAPTLRSRPKSGCGITTPRQKTSLTFIEHLHSSQRQCPREAGNAE